MAIERRLDLLGIIVLGVITAVGGGMIRDILIGVQPPSLFVHPIYVVTALAAVLVLFCIMKFGGVYQQLLSSEGYEVMMNVLDAIGLGVFTVVGMDTAMKAGWYPAGYYGGSGSLCSEKTYLRMRIPGGSPVLYVAASPHGPGCGGGHQRLPGGGNPHPGPAL